MTAPIPQNNLTLATRPTAPSEGVARIPAQPLALAEPAFAPAVSQKKMLPPHLRDSMEFSQQLAPAELSFQKPAMLGGFLDTSTPKGLGAQALCSVLDQTTTALATAQAGLELAADLASRAQFGGLKATAASVLADTAAQMPQAIASKVAGAINGGTDLRQVDVLQGIAHTQGPLAAESLEAGAYSADQLGAYGTDPMAGYGADPMAGYGADPMAGYGTDPMAGYGTDPMAGYGTDPMAGYGADALAGVASGLGELGGLGDLFSKPSSSHKPSAPESKPSSPGNKPPTADAKPSAPETKPSAPDAKPGVSAAKGSADDLLKAGAKIGAKGLGRFVPGANIAIAGMDIANAVKTIKDPKASVGDKITSGIVAGGSALAATNIPVVSQIGAAVSTGASVAGEVVKNFGGAIKEGAEKVVDTVKEGAKKVGEGIKDFFKGW